MHCFTGSLEFSKKLLALGAFFSASGIITFKNSTDLQNTFKNIPLEKLLIETDSPFLAPIPMRGRKNEPSFIKYTLEKLSLIKETTIKEMSNTTTNNFNNLFSL
jgi:TatD DNase family protein